MPQPMRQHSLAARMARWSGRHRKIAILGWLGLMAMLFVFSLVSPMNMIVYETSGPDESGRADRILYEDLDRPAEESVLIQSTALTAQSPQFQAVVAQTRDFDGRMATTGPLVFAFVLLLAFILTLVTFRSLVLAVKAVLLNLLSVAAALAAHLLDDSFVLPVPHSCRPPTRWERKAQ